MRRHLSDVKRTRELHRAQRVKSGVPTVSLVGYTNAGKSTLFNSVYSFLSDNEEEQVEAENILFKTLDTTTRKSPYLMGKTYCYLTLSVLFKTYRISLSKHSAVR